MAGPLTTRQGLRVDTDFVNYNDAEKWVYRRTKIVAVDGSGSPNGMWTVVRQVLMSPNGLKIGFNIQSRHKLKEKGSPPKAYVEFGIVNEGSPFNTTTELLEDSGVKTEVGNAFDVDGKWYGFRIPQQAGVVAKPTLCFAIIVENFQVKHQRAAYPGWIAAVEGGASFMDHFVVGMSVFTGGPTHNSVNFNTTVIAIP